MCRAIGHPVMSLKELESQISLKGLKTGDGAFLSPREIKHITNL